MTKLECKHIGDNMEKFLICGKWLHRIYFRDKLRKQWKIDALKDKKLHKRTHYSEYEEPLCQEDRMCPYQNFGSSGRQTIHYNENNSARTKQGMGLIKARKI